VTVLVIGYGNPGRGDDGVGPALAERIAALGLPGVAVDCDYQLTVDHAAPIAGAGHVVFADAAVDLGAPFVFAPLSGEAPQTLGSHTVTPQAAMRLAGDLFGHRPAAHVLAIGGRDFGEVAEGLSDPAKANLDAAVSFLAGWLRDAGN